MSDAPPRILIVDDDVEIAKSLAALLETVGAYETRIVHCAADAVAVAVEHAPAIVFLDIELPDMSGYDVAKLLHQHADLQAVRLIALTDNIEHPGREGARAAGFERYLVKPVTAIELQKVLRRSVSIGAGLSVAARNGKREPIYRGLP
ncbi:MAG TPA: response regulator [Steroidobacteraceae bacterium]|nr:response regulator [Steroidobacteraceae bacterium]